MNSALINHIENKLQGEKNSNKKQADIDQYNNSRDFTIRYLNRLGNEYSNTFKPRVNNYSVQNKIKAQQLLKNAKCQLNMEIEATNNHNKNQNLTKPAAPKDLPTSTTIGKQVVVSST